MGFIKDLVSGLTGNTPLLIKVVPGVEGIYIGIFRKEQLIPSNEIASSRMSKRLPPPLLNVVNKPMRLQDGYYVLPFPHAKQLCKQLQPYISENLQLDSTALDALQIIACPQDFAIYWEYQPQQQTLLRKLRNAEAYLGAGWIQHGQRVWRVAKELSKNTIGWISLPEIPAKLIFPFVSEFIPKSQEANLPFHCDLTIARDFAVTLKIENMLRDSLEASLESNNPQLLDNLQPLMGDAQNMISGTTLIPDIGRMMQPQLSQLIRSSGRIQGHNLPSFIQDELRPNAALLDVDMQLIDASYPIADAAVLSKEWQLEYSMKGGIGEYTAVPYLNWNSELVPLEVMLNQAKKGARFYQYAEGWIELTPSFLQRREVQKGEPPFRLEIQELLGTWTARLQNAKITPPPVTILRGNNEQESAEKFLDVTRQQGLPAALSGLQQDIIGIIRNICIYLRRDDPKAGILWIVSQRKKDTVIAELQRSGLSGKGFIVASPAELSQDWLRISWTLLILHDVDLLASNQTQARYYSQLNRRWTIGTFAKNTWNQSNQRLTQIMLTFRLRTEDAQAFQLKCVQAYTDQTEGFLARLGSPFKKVFISGEAQSSGVPIPPRDARSSMPTGSAARPRQEQSQISFSVSFATTSTGDNFIQQAKKYATRTEAKAEPVAFMQYWPTYDAMTPLQQRWYFYWRTQVRQGTFLPTDLSYVFVHIYEAINVIGFASARAAFEHLVKFWEHYRTLQPKLDRYLVDWIADFTVVHNLPQTPLDWYGQVLQAGVISGDVDLSIEAWLQSGADAMLLPADLLYKLASYSPVKNKFYQQHHEEDDLEEGLKKGVQAINQHLQDTTGKTLFETHQPGQSRTIERPAFASALHGYKQQTVKIAKVRPWMSNQTLTEQLKNILRQTENILREQANFRSKLRGIELSATWIEILENAFTPEPTPLVIDPERLGALTDDTNDVRARLLKGIEEPDDRSTQPAEAKASPESTLSPVYIPPRPIDTPEGLLTNLPEIAAIIGSSDSTEANIFRVFQAHEWQAAPATFGEAVNEGMFLDVIFDQINEKAYEQLDNALLFEEDGLWVVEEDYTDEIDYILTHPEYTAPIVAEVESSVDYGDLNKEWTGFVMQMQSHHWEALAALLSKTDVLSRLDAIARSVYVTANQLIDDINGFALDSIGDIVIDTSGNVPEVEEEDFDGLSQLMGWASEKMILEN